MRDGNTRGRRAPRPARRGRELRGEANVETSVRLASRENVIRRRSPAEGELAGGYLPATVAAHVAAREAVGRRREVAFAVAGGHASLATHPRLGAADAHTHVVGHTRRHDEVRA